MSQIDKNPSGPPKVEPHPPSTKPASSPLTMSHPAFAPAYISAPAAQYSQYPSSPTYLATAYPTGHEQWQHSPQQYANMPTGQYYATSVQLASPDAVNGAYIPQYGQWMPSSPYVPSSLVLVFVLIGENAELMNRGSPQKLFLHLCITQPIHRCLPEREQENQVPPEQTGRLDVAQRKMRSQSFRR